MIYICYIIYLDNVATCVLTVRDNELGVKDNNNTLLEVAKAGHMREGSGRSHRWA
jgi:hypothetical protein